MNHAIVALSAALSARKCSVRSRTVARSATAREARDLVFDKFANASRDCRVSPCTPTQPPPTGPQTPGRISSVTRQFRRVDLPLGDKRAKTPLPQDLSDLFLCKLCPSSVLDVRKYIQMGKCRQVHFYCIDLTGCGGQSLVDVLQKPECHGHLHQNLGV